MAPTKPYRAGMAAASHGVCRISGGFSRSWRTGDDWRAPATPQDAAGGADHSRRFVPADRMRDEIEATLKRILEMVKAIRAASHAEVLTGKKRR